LDFGECKLGLSEDFSYFKPGSGKNPGKPGANDQFKYGFYPDLLVGIFT
jgi:hypothetical protein